MAETERDDDMCDAGKLSDTDRKGEVRCECGNLTALIKKEGIELKCRRCKRYLIIPLKDGDWERKMGLRRK